MCVCVCGGILKPTPIIYPAFEKKTDYSYTWFHRKLTYSYSVLWTYIPFSMYILCDCGEGGNSGNIGTGLRVSILKPTPTIYPAFEKTHPIHILDITESRPIHIPFFEFIYPFKSSVICKQVYKWPSSRENLLKVYLWALKKGATPARRSVPKVLNLFMEKKIELYNIHVHNPEGCCFMVFPDLVRSV